MLRTGLLWTLIALLALGCAIPGSAGGLVLCVDRGDEGHVALEREGCAAPAPRAEPAPADPAADADHGTCESCRDFPLPSTEDARRILSVTAAALPPATPALPPLAKSPFAAAAAPPARAPAALPLLRLRI